MNAIRVCFASWRHRRSDRASRSRAVVPFLQCAALIAVSLLALDAIAATVDVIEYYDAGQDHYFMSSLQADIEALDSGQLKGWARTGRIFAAYPQATAGASPVCRFYIPPAQGDSHFYSASPAECAQTQSKFPTFIEESAAVMYVDLPDTTTGACPTGDNPVYRVWDDRVDSNHRYMTDRTLRAQMIAQGWLAEGYGPDQVIMCAPPMSVHPLIASFSVGPDEALTYPNSLSDPMQLVDLPDEHTTFMPPPPRSSSYLVFGASKIAGGTGGAVALATTDLTTFTFASAAGYSRQVMTPPLPIDQCNPAYDTEFDEGYAAPGSVVQDPTLPLGNLIMTYEAENHCPGGVEQQPFYASVGFARSSDNGKTWPASVNSPVGNAQRHPILTGANPEPAVAHPPMGDAIPSAFVDRSITNDFYLYVAYNYYTGGIGANDGLIRVARAKLGADPLNFQKWYSGGFAEPGLSGLDTGVTPGPGCTGGAQANAELSYNDNLGLYMLIFVCVNGPQTARVGAWYYSTATSLDLQNWTAPQMITNSQFPATSPCPGETTGSQFDGWYPSTMSPGSAAGHTQLTGRVYFLNGCNTGARQFMSRTFTIATLP